MSPYKNGCIFEFDQTNMTQFNIPGIKIGHATNEAAHTGCTVFLCPAGTVCSVDVRGPAPGSRETAVLGLDKRDIRVNAVVLTGGSAFGLASADGVMRYLGERGIGHYTPIRNVPIVPAAVVAIIWRFMVDSNFGVINDILQRIGIIESYQAWMAQPSG